MEGRTWDELVGRSFHVEAATPPHGLLAETLPNDPPAATPPHDRLAATPVDDLAFATGFIDLPHAEIPIEHFHMETEPPCVQTRRVSRVFAAKATHKGDGQDDDDEVQILGRKHVTKILRGYRKRPTVVPKAKKNRGKRGRYAPVPQTLPVVTKKLPEEIAVEQEQEQEQEYPRDVLIEGVMDEGCMQQGFMEEGLGHLADTEEQVDKLPSPDFDYDYK